ncbi:MAG: biotin-dependent carboxyltransferase family protein [Desertimonas sp.]
MGALTIVEAGIATSVQDRGRRGWAHLGVSTAGAMDEALAGQLNRLVGNADSAAVVETAGGLVVRADTAVTTATTPDVAVHHLAAGDEMRIDPQRDDLWGYIAVAGGVAVEAVLGSRSADSRSGIGPPSPRAGTRFDAGGDRPGVATIDQGAPPVRHGVVRVWPGPRRDRFDDEAWRALTSTVWTVTTEVSRVGARLAGPRLRPFVDEPLASEGLVIGAVQIPGDGQPVIMLRDHPTTGGYPVIAVVDPDDLAEVAQARPGRALRFRPV